MKGVLDGRVIVIVKTSLNSKHIMHAKFSFCPIGVSSLLERCMIINGNGGLVASR